MNVLFKKMTMLKIVNMYKNMNNKRNPMKQRIEKLSIDDWRKLIISFENSYPYEWFWKKKLPERKGQRCRVVARGNMNSILVEFMDGFKVLTSRFAVRKAQVKG